VSFGFAIGFVVSLPQEQGGRHALFALALQSDGPVLHALTVVAMLPQSLAYGCGSEAHSMYVLHIANKNYSSWSLRPWILMRAAGIVFEERLHRFEPGGAWASFRRFSPTGKVPTLHDGATVVWDSLAIVEYLAERHPGVWPEDTQARAWARAASAEMHSAFQPLRQHCSFNLGLRVRLHEVGPALQRDIDRLDEVWSEGLGRFGGPFLAGPTFTAVDAFFAPVQFRIQTYGLVLGPAAQAYSQRVLALAGMVDWYRAGIAEDFRDPEHDAVVHRFGQVTADFRVPEA